MDGGNPHSSVGAACSGETASEAGGQGGEPEAAETPASESNQREPEPEPEPVPGLPRPQPAGCPLQSGAFEIRSTAGRETCVSLSGRVLRSILES